MYRIVAQHAATVAALAAHLGILVVLSGNTPKAFMPGDLPEAVTVEVVAASAANADAAISIDAVGVAEDREASVRTWRMAQGDGKADTPGTSPVEVAAPLVAVAPLPLERPAPSAKSAARVSSVTKHRAPVPNGTLASDTLTAYAPPIDGWQGALRAGTAPSDVPSSWKVRLLSHLDRCKRYPDAARARRAEGTALLSFGMDRDGRVLGFYLVRSSGYSELDDEVLAMIERASPLPPAPPEMREQVVQLVVPIRFRL
jgi:periplasmic protein TonB